MCCTSKAHTGGGNKDRRKTQLMKNQMCRFRVGEVELAWQQVLQLEKSRAASRKARKRRNAKKKRKAPAEMRTNLERKRGVNGGRGGKVMRRMNSYGRAPDCEDTTAKLQTYFVKCNYGCGEDIRAHPAVVKHVLSVLKRSQRRAVFIRTKRE